MKAEDAVCGNVVAFVKDNIIVLRKVLFVKNGLCWFADGTNIPGKQEVIWRGARVKSFWISPGVLETFSQFECKDFSQVVRGQLFLLIERDLIEGIPDHDANFYPVFYDSRRNSLWNMSGEEFPISKFLCIDLGKVMDYFEMTPEGQEILRNAYPSDI